MNDRTVNFQPSQPQQGNANSKVIGGYIHKIENVPKEIRDYAINKLSVNAAGERIKDQHGNEIMARISTAKENGGYFGPVILNNEKFIVQAVGRNHLSAVVHQKSDVILKGESLALLDAKKMMNGTSLQIHYKGDKANAYHWSDKSRQISGPVQEKAPVKEAMKAEDLMKIATDYAKENIKNSNQRAAFLKHVGSVSDLAFTQQQPEAVKNTPALLQVKQAELKPLGNVEEQALTKQQPRILNPLQAKVLARLEAKQADIGIER